MVYRAAIDIGSNTVRILVADVQSRNRVIPVEKKLITTRLAEGLDETGIISKDAQTRTLAALQEYRLILEKTGVKKVRIGATSAVREAKNSKEFCRAACGCTGMEIEVFSGIEEARLSFLGVMASLPLIETGPALIIDIGGGSTELIWSEEGEVKRTISLPLGAVRCTEAFHFTEQVSVVLQERLQEHILSVLGTTNFLDSDPLCLGVGVGGTVTTLAAIYLELQEYLPELVHGAVLPLPKIQEIQAKLAGMKLAEIQKITCIQPERADIIVAGAAILSTLLQKLSLSEVIISEGDILEGMLVDSNLSE